MKVFLTFCILFFMGCGSTILLKKNAETVPAESKKSDIICYLGKEPKYSFTVNYIQGELELLVFDVVFEEERVISQFKIREEQEPDPIVIQERLAEYAYVLEEGELVYHGLVGDIDKTGGVVHAVAAVKIQDSVAIFNTQRLKPY